MRKRGPRKNRQSETASQGRQRKCGFPKILRRRLQNRHPKEGQMIRWRVKFSRTKIHRLIVRMAERRLEKPSTSIRQLLHLGDGGIQGLLILKRPDIAGPQSALATTRIISDILCVPYPEGASSPNQALNQNANEGKFRCVTVALRMKLFLTPPLTDMTENSCSNSGRSVRRSHPLYLPLMQLALNPILPTFDARFGSSPHIVLPGQRSPKFFQSHGKLRNWRCQLGQQ